MALQKRFDAVQGFTAPNAYHRIRTLSGDVLVITITVSTYFDATARVTRPSLSEKTYTFVPDSDTDVSLWKQAYQHLKIQEDFSGALDV